MRKTYAQLSPEAKRRARARAYANVYRRRGHLTPEPCARCGGPGEEMHHEDYAKPLDVTWLCINCHGVEHGADPGRCLRCGTTFSAAGQCYCSGVPARPVKRETAAA